MKFTNNSKAMFRINLQLFDVNMNLHKTNSTGDQDMTPEMKTFYSKKLLEDAKPNTVHEQFGQKASIPAHGGKQIEWRKFSSLEPATKPLIEGETPDGKKVKVEPVIATVEQYGDYVSYTDVVSKTTIDNVLLQFTKILANQAGQTKDILAREELNSGTSRHLVGGAARRSNLTANSVLTVKEIKRAVTTLKRFNAPTIDGYYIAIVHPDVAEDIMEDKEWIEAHQYTDAESIYAGEIGRIGKVRFIESTNAKIWTGAGGAKDDDSAEDKAAMLCPSGLAVYSTLLLGADAYGIVGIEGCGLEQIIKPLGAGNDPLNQRGTSGWKMSTVTKILDNKRMIRIESTSYNSAYAKSN